MSGIYIKHPADYVHTFEPYYRETEAKEIFNDGGLQTVLFHMQKGVTGCFQAVPGEKSAEVYYIKSGKMRLIPLDEDPLMIEEGGFFSFHNRMDGTLFYVVEDMEFLCVATTEYYDSNLNITKNIDRMLTELQEKDGDSRSHGERVRRLVMQMICHMKHFDGTQLEVLLQATRIHDVGKLRIPLQILIKPDKLTAEEYQIMQKHAIYSAEITKDLFDGVLSDILRHQHENYDGSGYPDGLKGEEIPLCSRVIAVADAFDAMVVTRTYHKGITEAEALAELRRCSGTQFDPECVEAFCKSIEDREFEEEDFILQKTEHTLAAYQDEKAKRDFLSNMSHDMRTPMNAIINLTALAKEDVDQKEKLQDDLDKIDISSRFLLGLVNDILDMSRMESGKMELHPTVCTFQMLNRYIESVIVPLCQEKNIHFEWNQEDITVPIYVDQVRYHQIFFNLLSNAVKYSDADSTISLSTENCKMDGNLLHVDFIFKDHGIGMSEEFQHKLFMPFEREDKGDARMGTGLGLAITKKIVNQMGGTIDVISKLGEGTCFIVHLDLTIPTQEQIEEDQLLKKEQKKTAQYFDIKGAKLLLAEDHPLNREIAVRLLHKVGADVDVAVNGKEAVAMFEKTKEYYYSAILMDVRMPVMDGLTATKQIRNLCRADAKRIPIIAMTAEAFEENRKETIAAGMNAHLSKPINPNDLFRTLATEIRY